MHIAGIDLAGNWWWLPCEWRAACNRGTF